MTGKHSAGLCVICLLLGAGLLHGADQEWTTYHGSPSLAGTAAIDLPDSPVELWRFLLGDPPSGTPVGGGGRVYAATDRGRIHAIGPDGREIWRVAAGADRRGSDGGSPKAERFSAPLLFTGDRLVIGSRLGIVYAFEASTGKPLWQYDAGGPVFGTANLVPPDSGGPESVVVISQSDGVAHRIDLVSGKGLLVSPTTNRCDGAAAVMKGRIAYGNCDAALYLLSTADLRIRKKIPLLAEGQVFAGVALTDDAVYAGDRSGRLYAADLSTGRILWVNEEGRDDISSTPAVHRERVIYSSDDGTVACLEKESGRTLWRSQIGGRPGEPVITTGGQVLVSADGSLHMLRLDDGTTIWSREISDEITSPAVVGDIVVVASDDGFIVAFGSSPATGSAP